MTARRIKTQYRSVAGYFFSEKNNKQIQFESQLEKNHFYVLEFDDTVIAYQPQPIKIEGTYNGKKVSYFPDVLIEREDYTKELVEVKYAQDLNPEKENDKKKLENRTRTIEEYCAIHNMTYSFFTEEDITSAYIENITFLYQYRTEPSDYTTYHDKVLSCAKIYTTPTKILNELAQSDFEKMMILPIIWYLIYTKEIEANLHIPLTNSSKIKRRRNHD